MATVIERLEGESEQEYTIRVCDKKLELMLTWEDVKNLINKELDKTWSESKYRKWYTAFDEGRRYSNRVKDSEIEAIKRELKHVDSSEILGNGTHKSTKLLQMNETQQKDVNFVLNAHGFDPKEWTLVNVRNNARNVSRKDTGIETLYSSNITVKPKLESEFDVKEFADLMIKKIKPFQSKSKVVEGDRLLTIPLFDLHFGINTFEDYANDIYDIADTIKSKKWDTILFVIGQDLVHNDSISQGRTTKGTPIDKVDMVQAIDDAKKAYAILFDEALVNSITVKAVYSKGNHDESIGYLFTRMLEATYPQIEFDTEPKQRKAFVWNNVFLGLTHGDTGSNRIGKNFLSEFGKQMAVCNTVEVLCGHIHHSSVKDDFGLTIRNLSTKAKTDDYHYENGFIGSHKNFQLFEFDENNLKQIHYI